MPDNSVAWTVHILYREVGRHVHHRERGREATYQGIPGRHIGRFTPRVYFRVASLGV